MIERCNARVKIAFFVNFDDPRLDQIFDDGRKSFRQDPKEKA